MPCALPRIECEAKRERDNHLEQPGEMVVLLTEKLLPPRQSRFGTVSLCFNPYSANGLPNSCGIFN
jgi:hypothetical protein